MWPWPGTVAMAACTVFKASRPEWCTVQRRLLDRRRGFKFRDMRTDTIVGLATFSPKNRLTMFAPVRLMNRVFLTRLEIMRQFFFGGHLSFLWGHWYPWFGLLVTSALCFKARDSESLYPWQDNQRSARISQSKESEFTESTSQTSRLVRTNSYQPF